MSVRKQGIPVQTLTPISLLFHSSTSTQAVFKAGPRAQGRFEFRDAETVNTLALLAQHCHLFLVVKCANQQEEKYVFV